MYFYTFSPIEALSWYQKFPMLGLVMSLSVLYQAVFLFGFFTAYPDERASFLKMSFINLAVLAIWAWFDFHFDTISDPVNEEVAARFISSKHLEINEEKISGKSKVYFSSTRVYATYKVGNEYVDVSACAHQAFAEKTTLYKNKVANRTTYDGRFIPPAQSCEVIN